MQKKKQGKSFKKEIRKILYLVVLILIIIFLILASIQFGLFNFFKKIYSKPEMFIIPDDCSVYFGTIIHKIKTEGDCGIYCTNECTLRKMDYSNIEFKGSDETCNSCNCFCK
jgi:hypothetical protein